MIKCIGYLKSLKQLLSILLISCFIFGLGSSASAVFPASVSVSPGDYYNSSDIDIDSFGISENLTFSKVITYKHFFTDDNIELDYAFYWDTDGYLHFYVDTNYGKSDYKVLEYNLVNSGTNTVIDQNQFINYVSNNIYNIYSVSFRFGYVCQSSPDVGTAFKITFNDGIYIYFSAGLCQNNNLYISPGGGPLSSPFSGTIDSLFSFSSPFSNSSVISPDGVELDSTQGALDYYENYYGWNSDICYIGVDSMNYLWGASGVSFNQGGGLNIFEGFNQLYGSSEPDKVYVWINSWLINYRNWFNRSDINEPPLYLVNYNYNNNSVDIYYDNLNFPFTNNPLGVYFMADFIDSKGFLCDSSCGSDVVSYCNIKLNGGTFEDIIDNSSKESINQYISQKNINNGLNGDGTEKTHSYNYFSTGTDYTGAVDFINYYVSKINGLINTNYDGPGFLPTYIILFMLALILFRFMSH